MSKPTSTSHTADGVRGALMNVFHIGDLMWLHMAFAVFSVVGGKLASTALSFMISSTIVLFKRF